MFLDAEGSTLEYVAGTDYDDFASSSIGVFIINDGAMTDSNTDTDSDNPPEEEEKGEPEKHSQSELAMEAKMQTQKTHEKCSGDNERSNCWPLECLSAAQEPSAASRDALLTQSLADYNKDLKKALKLSRKEMPVQDKACTEQEEMERVLELSLLEATEPKTEEEEIRIAIMASLEDVPTPAPNGRQKAEDTQSWTWNAAERREVENLLYIGTPTSTEDVESRIMAMRKPLKMWPKLYKIMDPIRQLLEPLTPFQWEGEQREALEQTKKQILTELLHTKRQC